MAVDMFLRLGDLKGESVDPAYKGSIDALAMSWGESMTPPAAGGGGTGKVNIQDLSVTKYIDKASVPLLLACASGMHFDTGTLICRRNGSRPYVFLKMALEEILVTSVSQGGSDGEDRFTENISLNFGKVTWTYTGEDGKVVTGSWDVAANHGA